jgi:phosphate transport system permease protein
MSSTNVTSNVKETGMDLGFLVSVGHFLQLALFNAIIVVSGPIALFAALFTQELTITTHHKVTGKMARNLSLASLVAVGAMAGAILSRELLADATLPLLGSITYTQFYAAVSILIFIAIPIVGLFASQRKVETDPGLARRNVIQEIAFRLTWVFATIAIALLTWIIGRVMADGIKVINLEFLTTRPAGGVSGEGGMSTTIVTTLYLVALTIIIATPLGVGAAIYLAEYAGEAQRESRLVAWLIAIARTGVEILAGVPSIIFGLFGFALFVSFMKLKFSLLSAGLSGACLILPVIIRTSEEALLAVPRSYREASLGLGATKWQTTWSVILPAATPGVVTGIILSIGRIVAETAIFWVTLGGSYRLPENLLSSGRSMALHVYMLATETRAFEKAMGTAAILIASIVLLNLTITYVSRRLTARVQGKGR